MITDYTSLVIEATSRTQQPGQIQNMPLLMGLAEKMIDRVVNFSNMESSATVTTDSDGRADLPDDFKEPLLVLVGSAELNNVSAIELVREVDGYAIKGAAFLSSRADTAHTVHYRMSLPTLNEFDSNFLLEQNPELYLYALMFQILTAVGQAEAASVTLGRFNQIAREESTTDATAVRGTSVVNIGGFGL